MNTTEKQPLTWLIERRHRTTNAKTRAVQEEWRACGRIRAGSLEEAYTKARAAVGDRDPDPQSVRVTGIAVNRLESIAKKDDVPDVAGSDELSTGIPYCPQCRSWHVEPTTAEQHKAMQCFAPFPKKDDPEAK